MLLFLFFLLTLSYSVNCETDIKEYRSLEYDIFDRLRTLLLKQILIQLSLEYVIFDRLRTSTRWDATSLMSLEHVIFDRLRTFFF